MDQQTDQNENPRVGIAVMIFKDGKVLLGKRKGSHGEGEYASPGGHLEYMESFAGCAIREVREECGLEITNIRFLMLANILAYKPKHYVHITLLADWKSGEPEVREPDKCEGWQWYDVNKLPAPLFYAISLSFQALKSGQNYFDS
jgi:8-oxo-dGTP diphosphatase